MTCNCSRDARDPEIERIAGIRRKKQIQQAAPDLLAALQNLVNACQFWDDPAVADARDAIAKANRCES